MQEFSKRLKQLRSERGLSQMDLAKATGKDRSSITNYEMTGRESDYKTLSILADALHTSTDYLLGRTDIKLPVDEIARLTTDKDTEGGIDKSEETL